MVGPATVLVVVALPLVMLGVAVLDGTDDMATAMKEKQCLWRLTRR